MFGGSFLIYLCYFLVSSPYLYPSQINAGEKVDSVQAAGYHESSAGILDDEEIESAVVSSTVALIQVP